MPHLGRSASQMRAEYDAVVVGSGYGGGVAASRLAQLGLKVAVLERGREYLPGDFPATLGEAQRETQISRAGKRFGSPLALFDLRLGGDVHALVGCGVGGTSLINANVCLNPDPRVFEDDVWPEALRADHWLNTGFHRARQMLAPEPLPEKYSPLKLQALGLAAQALGHRAERTPVHIAFTKRTNWAGVTQPACTQCGDCMSGCNVGAKTTVHSTYLADAASRGSEIFTHAQVRAVERAQDGRWRVLYTLQDGATRAVPTRVVTAPMVILAAGSLGTSEILLRSRERGLPLSDQLGKRFSTNADAIALGYNNKMPVNAVGVGNPPRARVAKPGPAVTGIIDLRQREHPLERLAVVEAAIQSPLAPLLPLVMAALAPTGTSSDRNLGSFIEEAQRTASSLLKGAYQGAVHNTQLFLAVGHDRAAGQLVLEHDRVAVSWPEAVHEPVYERIHATFAKAIAATGGTHIPNPVSNRFLGGNVFTFHPLGGCGMGRDRAVGVVDHKCRVFDGDPAKPGDTVHSGLYVCDGSIVPRSLGIHPLLTITALAERAMLLLARDLGRELPVEAPEDVAQAGAPKERGPGFFARLFGGARSGAG